MFVLLLGRIQKLPGIAGLAPPLEHLIHALADQDVGCIPEKGRYQYYSAHRHSSKALVEYYPVPTPVTGGDIKDYTTIDR
jgi:hypothetical protein